MCYCKCNALMLRLKEERRIGRWIDIKIFWIVFIFHLFSLEIKRNITSIEKRFPRLFLLQLYYSTLPLWEANIWCITNPLSINFVSIRICLEAININVIESYSKNWTLSPLYKHALFPISKTVFPLSQIRCFVCLTFET